MPEYSVGDKIILKDDGQVYSVVGVRIEDHIVLFDLEKGNEKGKAKLTVVRSQIEAQKICTPKYPQTAIFKARYRPS